MPLAPNFVEPFARYALGQRYHLHDRIWKDGAGFGSPIGGIVQRGAKENRNAIMVLAEVGPSAKYQNYWDGPDLIYSGEDDRWAYPGEEKRRRDQSLEKAGNALLATQHQTQLPLYLFWKTTGEADYIYAGLAEVSEARLVQRDSRLVAQFRLHPLGVARVSQIVEAERELEDPGPPILKQLDRPRVIATRGARDTAFTRVVLRAYGYTCSVCGERRVDAAGRPEVQAAHIFPREYDGSDDPRNGISLCRLHHWAFDGLLFDITDDFVIRCKNGGENSRGVAEFRDERLRILPAEPQLRPHPVFLSARRELKAKPARSRRAQVNGSPGSSTAGPP